MKALLKMDGRTEAGGSSVLMHNERLANPLDPFAEAVSQIAGVRKKTRPVHLDLAYAEFVGGLYSNGNGPCLPAWNIIRCLQEGATRFKRGRDVLRGVHPVTDHADLTYEGPRDFDELWKGEFWITKGVGVGQSKVMRTRPKFDDWKAELLVEIDPEIFNLSDVAQAWNRSGRYVGIGDGRPIFGRFDGIVEEVDDEAAAKLLKRLSSTTINVATARKGTDAAIAAVEARARAYNGKHT